jgi:tight adherence protein C
MSALAWVAVPFAAAAAALAGWLATSGAGLAALQGFLARLRVAAKSLQEGRAHRQGPAPDALRVAIERLGALLAPRRQSHSRARRRSQCLEELPELIDVVALGMSAGISFDAALAIYCQKYDTHLALQLADAMRSWQLGLSTRGEALHALAASLSVPAFTTFVDTATESLAYGAPLARSLGEQSRAVRAQRRADVEERIEKAPVKMLVPTGTLILPAMLLAVLGPLLASLSELTG